MKTRGYVKKYKLDEDDQFNHTDFINDFTEDFNTMFSDAKIGSDYGKFKKLMDDSRQKWGNINNKTVGHLPEKLWGYFYGSVIVAKKDELFPQFINRDIAHAST